MKHVWEALFSVSQCHSVKSRAEFHVKRAANDGLSPRCKPCQIASVLATVDPARVKRYSKSYNDAHQEQKRAYAQADYWAHRTERCAKRRAYYYANRDRLLAEKRERNRLRRLALGG